MPSRVIDALHIAPGEVIGDIGAGTGYFTVRLARAGAKPKVYAVDIEPSMIEHLRHAAMRVKRWCRLASDLRPIAP
jgi:Precorrin-6B methylase 2